MNKHPLTLLSETKGMNGYQFNGWLSERTNLELKALIAIADNLKRKVNDGLNKRNPISKHV